MTHHNPARPCSSPLVPAPGDDHKLSGRPGTSPPPGTTRQRESNDDHQKPARSSQPTGTTYNPGTVWLTTPRSTPAWTAAAALLDDNQWHPRQDLIDAMQAAGLARRTIHHHLRSASQRGWIRQHRGKVKLRDRHALDAALGGATT
jgi:hypothetical protein